MKKRKCLLVAVVILAVAIGVVFLVHSTVSTNKDVVWIDENRSWFRDFYVSADMVKIKCTLFIENQSDQDASVMMLGNFEADHKGGLLKETQLLGSSEEYPKSVVFLIPPGGVELNVDFIGAYGGVSEKQNRLLPEIQLIPVQDAVAAIETAQIEHLDGEFDFETGNLKSRVVVNAVLSGTPVGAYTGEDGYFDQEAQSWIHSLCPPMPIDSIDDICEYLDVVYPLLIENNYVSDGYVPYEVCVYENDTMCITFQNPEDANQGATVEKESVFISLENGVLLGYSRSG